MDACYVPSTQSSPMILHNQPFFTSLDGSESKDVDKRVKVEPRGCTWIELRHRGVTRCFDGRIPTIKTHLQNACTKEALTFLNYYTSIRQYLHLKKLLKLSINLANNSSEATVLVVGRFASALIWRALKRLMVFSTTKPGCRSILVSM